MKSSMSKNEAIKNLGEADKISIKDLAAAGMIHSYKVEINSYCEHSEREPEEFGSWEESFSNSLGKVKRTSKKEYGDVLSKFDLKKGDDAFVVWIEYSTGDSFGHAERGSTMAIGIFTDVKAARVLAAKINEYDRDVNTAAGDKFKYGFKTPDGQFFECGYAPWLGYFEHLNEVHVDVVEIQ